LLDTKGGAGKNGLLYIMMQWREEGKPVDEALPPEKHIQQFYKGVEPKGQLVIKAIKAVDILGVEKGGQYSDAYLKLVFNKKDQKTSVVQSLEPVWNKFFYYKVSFKDRSVGFIESNYFIRKCLF